MSNKNDLANKGCTVMNSCVGFCDKWQVTRAIELMVLVALCFAAGRVLSYFIGWGNAEFSGCWVIISALLVYTEHDTMNFADLLQWRLTSVALGVGAAFVVLSMFGVNYFGLLAAVLLVAWLCEFFKWQKYQQLALISLSVLVVSNYLKVDSTLWASAIGRVLEAAIGMLLAYGVHLAFHWLKDCRGRSGQ